MILRDADARSRWRWAPYFAPDEFACRHCRAIVIDTEFLDALYPLRAEFGRPLVITSGYRCAIHNRAVSTTGDDGPHTTGAAADFALFGRDAFELVALAPRYGINGLGVKQRGEYAGRFIHADMLRKGRPMIWSY